MKELPRQTRINRESTLAAYTVAGVSHGTGFSLRYESLQSDPDVKL